MPDFHCTCGSLSERMLLSLAPKQFEWQDVEDAHACLSVWLLVASWLSEEGHIQAKESGTESLCKASWPWFTGGSVCCSHYMLMLNTIAPSWSFDNVTQGGAAQFLRVLFVSPWDNCHHFFGLLQVPYSCWCSLGKDLPGVGNKPVLGIPLKQAIGLICRAHLNSFPAHRTSTTALRPDSRARIRASSVDFHGPPGPPGAHHAPQQRPPFRHRLQGLSSRRRAQVARRRKAT